MSADDELPHFNVELTRKALADLKEIQAYIAETLGVPGTARHTVKKILDVADTLSVLPHRNRTIATRTSGQEIRLARSGSYVLLYAVEGRTVRIFSILHGTRDIQNRLGAMLESLE